MQNAVLPERLETVPNLQGQPDYFLLGDGMAGDVLMQAAKGTVLQHQTDRPTLSAGLPGETPQEFLHCLIDEHFEQLHN